MVFTFSRKYESVLSIKNIKFGFRKPLSPRRATPRLHHSYIIPARAIREFKQATVHQVILQLPSEAAAELLDSCLL